MNENYYRASERRAIADNPNSVFSLKRDIKKCQQVLNKHNSKPFEKLSARSQLGSLQRKLIVVSRNQMMNKKTK